MSKRELSVALYPWLCHSGSSVCSSSTVTCLCSAFSPQRWWALFLDS